MNICTTMQERVWELEEALELIGTLCSMSESAEDILTEVNYIVKSIQGDQL